MSLVQWLRNLLQPAQGDEDESEGTETCECEGLQDMLESTTVGKRVGVREWEEDEEYPAATVTNEYLAYQYRCPRCGREWESPPAKMGESVEWKDGADGDGGVPL